MLYNLVSRPDDEIRRGYILNSNHPSDPQGAAVMSIVLPDVDNEESLSWDAATLSAIAVSMLNSSAKSTEPDCSSNTDDVCTTAHEECLGHVHTDANSFATLCC